MHKKIKSLLLLIFGAFNLLGQSNCDYQQEYQDLIDRGVYLKSIYSSDSANYFLAAKLLCPETFETFEYFTEHQEKKKLDQLYIESQLPILKTFDHYSFFTFDKDLKFSIYDQDRADSLSFFFCVIMGKGVGILKFDGSLLFPPIFDVIKHIGSGNFKVEKDSFFGVVNYLGDTIIDLQYPYSYEIDTILTVDPYTYEEILKFKKRQVTKILSYDNKWFFAYRAKEKFSVHLANGKVILKGVEEFERLDKEGNLFFYKKELESGIIHYKKGLLLKGQYSDVAYINDSKLLLKSSIGWELIEIKDKIKVHHTKYQDYLMNDGLYALKDSLFWNINFSEYTSNKNPVYRVKHDEKVETKLDIYYKFNPATYEFDEKWKEQKIQPDKLKVIRLSDKLLLKAHEYWSIYFPDHQKLEPLLFDTAKKSGDSTLIITEGRYYGLAYYDKRQQTIHTDYFDDLIALNKYLFLITQGGHQAIYDTRTRKIISQ